MFDHALAGSSFAEVSTQPAPAAPGRATLAQNEPGGVAPRSNAVAIAPDRRDHRRTPALGAELDVQLRTLIAHLDRNVARFESASAQPERDAALDTIETRVDVALRHVPDAQHGLFRAELVATLGTAGHAALAGVLARAEGSHGARAATWLGVQLDAEDDSAQELSPEAAHAIASHGTDGDGGALPHLDAIQKSFGHHDIGGVRAHVGGTAREASAALGARAYASGDAVAFAAMPDLHLAAHEAAHVVQQRGGVRLASAVGATGDAYERHADAVADLVVRGESAEALLDQHAHRGATGGSAIQRVAEPRPYIRAIIDAIPTAAAALAAVAQLDALRPTPRDGAREYTITIGTARHVIAGCDVRFLLARARHRATALAPVYAAAIADPSAISRPVLAAAVARAHDIGELETARDSIIALHATPPAGTVPVALAGATYAVGAPDLAYVLQLVETRLREVGTIRGDLVDSTVSPSTDTFAHDPAPPIVPPDSDASSDVPPIGFQAGITVPMEWEITTPLGRVKFELGIETQVHASATGHDAVTVEVPARLGRRSGGRVTRGIGGGVSTEMDPLGAGARSLVEQVIHTRFDTAGHDRMRVEYRDGDVRGSLGWDFGTIHSQHLDVGFRFTAVQWSSGRGLEFAVLEIPVTTEWWNVNDNLRVRARGAISFTPNRAAIMRAAGNLITRATTAGTATATAVDTTATATASTAADTAAAATADTAAAVVAEDTFGAALLAAGETGLALMGPIALVGVFAVATLSVVLAGCALAYELGRESGASPRRRRSPAMSHDTADEALSTYGASVHDRIRTFCLGYADAMRGVSPRATGHGAMAGATAAYHWMRELETQGHTIADIRAAARSAPDLEQRVLEASRAGFEAQLDPQVSSIRYRLYQVGADDGEATQRAEWITRHLHACISLAEVAPPAPEFQFDPCRSTAHEGWDGQTLDDHYQPFDPSACPPDASDADAPNPASGIEDDGRWSTH